MLPQNYMFVLGNFQSATFGVWRNFLGFQQPREGFAFLSNFWEKYGSYIKFEKVKDFIDIFIYAKFLNFYLLLKFEYMYIIYFILVDYSWIIYLFCSYWRVYSCLSPHNHLLYFNLSGFVEDKPSET